MWYYVEIFCSEEASLLTRIRYAANVTHVLAIWQNLVYRDGNLKLATNFITRETYIDVLLSCHFDLQLPPTRMSPGPLWIWPGWGLLEQKWPVGGKSPQLELRWFEKKFHPPDPTRRNLCRPISARIRKASPQTRKYLATTIQTTPE